MTDKEISALLDAGRGEDAFNALVSTYGEALYWHLRHFVLRHEDADDLLQETYIKVWTGLPRFRGESGFFTWLWRIATNKALDFLRREKLRSVFSPASALPEDRIDEDPWFDGDAAETALLKAVCRLPLKQRQVFVMRWFDDLPYEKISGITGTSVGALKTSYHIAEKKIREELGREI